MTMLELQETLSRTIKGLEDGTMDKDKAKSIASVAKQMINNADIVLRTDKYVNNKGKRSDRLVGNFED